MRILLSSSRLVLVAMASWPVLAMAQSEPAPEVPAAAPPAVPAEAQLPPPSAVEEAPVEQPPVPLEPPVDESVAPEVQAAPVAPVVPPPPVPPATGTAAASVTVQLPLPAGDPGVYRCEAYIQTCMAECDDDDREDCHEDCLDDAIDEEICADPDDVEDDDDGHSVGAFGGPSVEASWFGNRPGLVLGGSAGVILGRGLILGGGAKALWTPVEGPPIDQTDSSLALMYGGFLIGFQVCRDHFISGSATALIGGGAVTLLPRIGNTDKYLWDAETQTGDGFFVVEPSLQVHAQFTRWVRLTLSGSYRMVSGVNFQGLSGRQLRGPSLGGAVQFGWF